MAELDKTISVIESWLKQPVLTPPPINELYDALELLKEQEAVKPKSKVRHGETCQYQHWCGNCMVMLHGKPKFCPNCGNAVKWE